MAKTTIVIPVRYESKRFPGKALVKIGKTPLIQHVYQQAQKVKGVEEVLVATDDERIQWSVEELGGRAQPPDVVHEAEEEEQRRPEQDRECLPPHRPREEDGQQEPDVDRGAAEDRHQ